LEYFTNILICQTNLSFTSTQTLFKKNHYKFMLLSINSRF
jgi:hypothetical protein